MRRWAAVVLAASLVGAPAWAENAMGYRLLSPEQASGLPHNHGGLGLSVQRAQQIDDQGMSFELMRVTQVAPGSPGAQARLKPGDMLIAVDGTVFPTLAAFAAYVGSLQPGQRATLDYIPAGGGPAQAQRVGVMIAPRPGQAPPPPAEQQQQGGLSTGAKVAIGVGAAALLGCYEMGCLSRLRGHRPAPASPAPASPAPGAYQPAQQPGFAPGLRPQ